MKYKFNDTRNQGRKINDLQMERVDSIDHTGLFVASFSALIIILIGAFTENFDIFTSYFVR